MAESLLLPLVHGVAGKAADVLVRSVTRMWDLEHNRNKLERRLLAVRSLLADSEAENEINIAIKRWMKDLKAVAYQADDDLDDLQYEALRRQALSGMSKAIKVFSNMTSTNQFLFRDRVSRDLNSVHRPQCL
ncbi:hypothetical protein ACP4OV_005349 [Aristida adscensionis]